PRDAKTSADPCHPPRLSGRLRCVHRWLSLSRKKEGVSVTFLRLPWIKLSLCAGRSSPSDDGARGAYIWGARSRTCERNKRRSRVRCPPNAVRTSFQISTTSLISRHLGPRLLFGVQA